MVSETEGGFTEIWKIWIGWGSETIDLRGLKVALEIGLADLIFRIMAKFTLFEPESRTRTKSYSDPACF